VIPMVVIANPWINMFLKFKNKMQMAIDKMLEDSKKLGGEPLCIMLEPNEAYSLLKEAADNKEYYKGKLSVTKEGEENIPNILLWSNTFTTKDDDSIRNMVNDWYKLKYRVTYSNVELKIEKPKTKKKPMSEAPPPPQPPGPRSVTGLPAVNDDNVQPVTKQFMDSQVPPEPKPPLNRLLSEGNTLGHCEKCGSSLKSKWLFFKAGGCIHPECEDYWKIFHGEYKPGRW